MPSLPDSGALKSIYRNTTIPAPMAGEFSSRRLFSLHTKEPRLYYRLRLDYLEPSSFMTTNLLSSKTSAEIKSGILLINDFPP